MQCCGSGLALARIQTRLLRTDRIRISLKKMFQSVSSTSAIIHLFDSVHILCEVQSWRKFAADRK
jgi:hypothetical protein